MTHSPVQTLEGTRGRGRRGCDANKIKIQMQVPFTEQSLRPGWDPERWQLPFLANG